MIEHFKLIKNKMFNSDCTPNTAPTVKQIKLILDFFEHDTRIRVCSYEMMIIKLIDVNKISVELKRNYYGSTHEFTFDDEGGKIVKYERVDVWTS